MRSPIPDSYPSENVTLYSLANASTVFLFPPMSRQVLPSGSDNATSAYRFLKTVTPSGTLLDAGSYTDAC